ncbi:hypothetical protein CDL12_25098 [Handroanthus impetiginosus]|uniref:Tf2-1-like SH3-like domain-containing protein n=1 Tax=Handroanthus impetiginosus TaxID=429701 RepID=A0A2G9GBM7_9LAMI|nr:hypothetical protein CDL12_25098 [Handroanthus impetiginosus]
MEVDANMHGLNTALVLVIQKNFGIGNLLYLELHTYYQNSLSLCRDLKLAPKYCGPYKITGNIAGVAYRMELSSNNIIHLKFHISLLKQKIGRKHSPTIELLEMDKNGIFKNNMVVAQIFVQWAHLSLGQAT